MPINFSPLPTSLDSVHLGLAALVILFFILFMKKNAAKTSANASNEHIIAETPPVSAPQLVESSPESALQLLSLLQHEARFIDFIQEDLQAFSDADIGAAARIVHEGSQKTLSNYFSFAPIRNEDEESTITLNQDFDASEVRLTGNVVGEAPFTGTLVHRGWKVTEVNLPKLATGHNVNIVAAAEVEL